MTSDHAERRRNVRRSTFFFVGIALAFYLGFILMAILRS